MADCEQCRECGRKFESFDLDKLQAALQLYPVNDGKCFSVKMQFNCSPTEALEYVAAMMLRPDIRQKVLDAREGLE